MRTLTLTPLALASLLALAGAPAHAQTYQMVQPVAGLKASPPVTDQPAFSLSASALDFGSVAAPAAAEVSVLVANTGNVPLGAPVITVAGEGFFAAHNCAQSLAAAATCAVTGTFAPTAAQGYTGLLTVGYAGLPAQTATLSGAGLQNPTLSAPSVAFASAGVGLAAPNQTITVTNTSTAPLTISSTALSGASASQFSVAGCAGFIAPGAACLLTVGFVPTGQGAATAAIAVTHTGSQGPLAIGLSAFTSSPADPNFSSVSLLLNGDGVEGATQFLDSGPLALAMANGTPLSVAVSTVSPAFGTGSLRLTGGLADVRTSASPGLSMGTATDFTVEAWLNPAAFKVQMSYLSQWDCTNTPGDWILATSDQGHLQVVVAGYSTSATWGTSTNTLTLNNWNHVALTRQAGTWRMFVNGVQGWSATTAYAFGSGTKPTFLGNYQCNTGNSRYTVNGQLDEIRVTKGVARYTSNFSVPVAPFPTN